MEGSAVVTIVIYKAARNTASYTDVSIAVQGGCRGVVNLLQART
jgi:hypothetical protein